MKYIIKNATIVNEGLIFKGSVALSNGLIEKILPDEIIHAERLEADKRFEHYQIIDARGLHLIPGVIDDQVHFRDPGLTHKGDIFSESRAAVAGGITSFMEMPNTVPNTLTQELLADKFRIASEKSLTNYSFYLGASNDNLSEIIKTDPGSVCGVKIFMGSSTGNMLVDDPKALEGIFKESPVLVAVHCEDESTIQQNQKLYRENYGDEVPVEYHPAIRSAEACYKSSSLAVELATKFNTRLHVLHLSTAMEMSLFRNDIPLEQKRITAEVCVHHLWFSDQDYQSLKMFIKWNPAIKSAADREALRNATLNNRIDVIATDHAPHTYEEKMNPYFKAPSGGPLVQHSLTAMLEMYHHGYISLPQIVAKMSHAPAVAFQIQNRGFIREGFAADLVLLNLNSPWTVSTENILYKCGWSPFNGTTFRSRVVHTFVNGNLVYDNGIIDNNHRGQALRFTR